MFFFNFYKAFHMKHLKHCAFIYGFIQLVAQKVKKKKKKMPAMKEMRVQSLGQDDPLEKEMATTPVFLPEEFHVRPMGSQRVGHK